MSQIQKLTYTVKTNPAAVTDRTKQATAEDFNEIKTTVNECVDGINGIKANSQNVVAGANTIAFLAAYPIGTSYAILTHRCYDADGFEVAHTITGKSNTGFTLTSPVAGTFLYSTQPIR